MFERAAKTNCYKLLDQRTLIKAEEWSGRGWGIKLRLESILHCSNNHPDRKVKPESVLSKQRRQAMDRLRLSPSQSITAWWSWKTIVRVGMITETAINHLQCSDQLASKNKEDNFRAKTSLCQSKMCLNHWNSQQAKRKMEEWHLSDESYARCVGGHSKCTAWSELDAQDHLLCQPPPSSNYSVIVIDQNMSIFPLEID